MFNDLMTYTLNERDIFKPISDLDYQERQVKKAEMKAQQAEKTRVAIRAFEGDFVHSNIVTKPSYKAILDMGVEDVTSGNQVLALRYNDLAWSTSGVYRTRLYGDGDIYLLVEFDGRAGFESAVNPMSYDPVEDVLHNLFIFIKKAVVRFKEYDRVSNLPFSYEDIKATPEYRQFMDRGLVDITSKVQQERRVVRFKNPSGGYYNIHPNGYIRRDPSGRQSEQSWSRYGVANTLDEYRELMRILLNRRTLRAFEAKSVFKPVSREEVAQRKKVVVAKAKAVKDTAKSLIKGLGLNKDTYDAYLNDTDTVRDISDELQKHSDVLDDLDANLPDYVDEVIEIIDAQFSMTKVVCKQCGHLMDLTTDATRYFRGEPEAWSCPSCSYTTEEEENPRFVRVHDQDLDESPRQVTKTFTYYTFNELSDEAKQNAIEKLRDINVDYDWWENDYISEVLSDKYGIAFSISEDFGFDLDRGQYVSFGRTLEIKDSAKFLKRVAAPIAKPYYLRYKQLALADKKPVRKLSLSNRDIFKPASDVDVKQRDQDKMAIAMEDFYQSVSKGEYTEDEEMSFTFDHPSGQSTQILVVLPYGVPEGIISDIESWFNDDVVGFALGYLQKEFDYMMSDEGVIDTIKNGDYEFDEDGDVVHS